MTQTCDSVNSEINDVHFENDYVSDTVHFSLDTILLNFHSDFSLFKVKYYFVIFNYGWTTAYQVWQDFSLPGDF
jgi:hypothetical protein